MVAYRYQILLVYNNCLSANISKKNISAKEKGYQFSALAKACVNVKLSSFQELYSSLEYMYSNK